MRKKEKELEIEDLDLNQDMESDRKLDTEANMGSDLKPNAESDTVSSADSNTDAISGKPDSQKKFPINFHIVLILAIVIIAAVSIYRLFKWNQGTQLEEIDENADTSEFDIETLDMILPIDASRLEGHEEDNTTTILCLGNNPFSDDRGKTGLASKIAAKTDSVVYDCSFPDSSAACKYSYYDPSYTKDHFNLFYVVECFRSNEFTAINSIAGDEPDPRYQEAVDVMKTVDMDKVDILIIMYDSTDYNIGTPSDNPDNPYDVTAFTGGLRTALANIQSTWPHIRVFVMSPAYAQYQDENGNLLNGTITDIGNGTLNHYLVMEYMAATDCSVSFIDNYFGTINEDNYEEYMEDYMHYNEAGREKLADRIADIINNHLMTVYSSTAE